MAKIEKLTFFRGEQIALMEDMAALLDQGLSPIDIAKDYANFGKGSQKVIGEELIEAMSSGGSFADGFNGWVDELSLQTLRASEKSGDIRQGFLMVYDYMTQTSGMAGKLFKALIGPIVLILFVLFGVQIISNMIFPELAKFMPTNTWPGISIAVYDLGLWLESTLLYIVVFLLVYPFFMMFLFKNLTGPVRRYLDYLPGFTHYRMLLVGQVCHNLAYQLASGKGFIDSLLYLERNSGRYLKSHLSVFIANVKGKKKRAGGNLGNILDSGLLLPREAMRLKRVGRQGNYEELLVRTGNTHTKILDKQIGAIAAVLGTVSKAGAALLMICVVAAIMMLAVRMKSQV